MNNKILKTTLSVSLVLATLAGATTVYAKSKLNDLNLTDTQIEQLNEFRENKKEAREAQKATDKAALAEFLSAEQIDAIMNKDGKGHKKDKMKNAKRGNGMQMLLKQADQLELTENQVAQIKIILEANKPVKGENSERASREEMQAKHDVVKTQIEALLTQEQIEKLEAMQADKHEGKKAQKGSNK